MCFTLFYNKECLLGYKKKKSKSRKIEIFRKQLVHGFGPALAIFACFYFWQ